MFCKNCGNKIEESAKFCGGCGSSNDKKELRLHEDTELSLLKKEVKKIATRLILKGLAIILFAGIISWITYLVAAPGGTYIVSVGAFIFGIADLLKGLFYFIFPSSLIKNKTDK